MPRGSKIGERRGGRQRGTPNRRTILADRILAIASEHPTAPTGQFIDILVKDRELPAAIRMAIARQSLPAGASPAARAARPASKRRKAEPAGSPKTEPPSTLVTLDILFSVMQDTTVPVGQRRKAATEAAQHFLPKKPGTKRWWVNAPVDQYGFAITPEIAAEYRDIKFESRHLARSGSNSPRTRNKVEKLRARMNAILHRLQCPCPSKYGSKQRTEDRDRLIYFLRQREAKISLREEANAEEAHRRARVDAFDEGPESAARLRLSELRDKARIRNPFGPRLTRKERTDLRCLRLLYPQQSPHYYREDDLSYHPLRDAPFAEDGNLYPPDSKLRPLKDGDIEEFVHVPPYFYPPHAKLPRLGDRGSVYVLPDFPGFRWSDS